MNKPKRQTPIALEKCHLLSASETKNAISNIGILFFIQWSMFDKILIANDDYINRIRRDEVETYFHELNGNLLTQQQADIISESFGDYFREAVKSSKMNWERQFEFSQNYLRITHLAQTFLFWEDSIRSRLLDLINFDHPDITIVKSESTIRANTFGDLRNIRNSFWHSRSGELGICNFEKSEFKELTQFMNLNKGERMVLDASQLPKIGSHLYRRISEFPSGYKLGVI